jgi:hypothetical protein
MEKNISHPLLLVLGISILLGLLGLSCIYALTLGKSSIIYSDYGKFYHSQRLFLKGENIYSYVYFIRNKHYVAKKHIPLAQQTRSQKATTFILGPNLNPPFFTLLSFPLAYLSYPQALLLWTLLSLLAGGLSILLIQQKLDPHSLKSLTTCVLLLIALFGYFPSFSTLELGQVSFFLLLLLTLAWRAAHDEKATLAAVFLGLAASLKPFVGLFLIYFILRKEWRALAVFLSSILTCSVIAAAVFGPTSYASYVHVCQHIGWASSNWNVSLYGFLSRLLGGTETNTPLLPHPHLFPAAYSILALLFFLALIYFLRPLAAPLAAIDKQQKTDLDFSIMLSGMLLLSPLGWMYYLPLLSIPFLMLWHLAKQGFFPLALPLLLATLLLLSNIPTTLISGEDIQSNNVLRAFSGSCLYFAALMGFTALLFFIRQQLPKKSAPSFARIPTQLLLLVYTVVFLPSILGILKSSSDWIQQGAYYSKEYTLLTDQD